MSPNFPNLLSPAFLTFSTCPLNPTVDPSRTAPTVEASPGTPRQTYLLATISQNMTLSTTPTFICTDSASVSFALTVILEAPLTPAQLEGSVTGNGNGSRGGDEFDIKKLKKGHTVVVPNPRRHGVREGKQGYIRCAWDDLAIIPASLERLLGISKRFLDASENIEENSRGNRVTCQSCERRGSEEELSRCKGCSEVWYCGKECQTEGWNSKGHKSECKILQTVGGMDLSV
ncbi:14d3c16e-dbd7-4e8a-87c3-a8289bf82955 [Sclerotinia trifoliorum]|uniref:14d3c16e-dbd7-4e8a-87c3-a8289bf82955 n=1 Tax=Sclerotinia trifoliorum TaxID=28548 RepID=A0A8H2ZS54_9HELO|nr:14d3c16e-dbd7-4e8a-87c3-a8289bf82955 [Sclerotinia trifoliorum]